MSIKPFSTSKLIPQLEVASGTLPCEQNQPSLVSQPLLEFSAAKDDVFFNCLRMRYRSNTLVQWMKYDERYKEQLQSGNKKTSVLFHHAISWNCLQTTTSSLHCPNHECGCGIMLASHVCDVHRPTPCFATPGHGKTNPGVISTNRTYSMVPSQISLMFLRVSNRFLKPFDFVHDHAVKMYYLGLSLLPSCDTSTLFHCSWSSSKR